jgi:hypothetical protein
VDGCLKDWWEQRGRAYAVGRVAVVGTASENGGWRLGEGYGEGGEEGKNGGGEELHYD